MDRTQLDMDLTELNSCIEFKNSSISEVTSISEISPNGRVSLETEIPEVLYKAMKDFIGANPTWDQYQVMSSALANFLFQNGCGDRAVTERYLNDLFARSEA